MAQVCSPLPSLAVELLHLHAEARLLARSDWSKNVLICLVYVVTPKVQWALHTAAHQVVSLVLDFLISIGNVQIPYCRAVLHVLDLSSWAVDGQEQCVRCLNDEEAHIPSHNILCLNECSPSFGEACTLINNFNAYQELSQGSSYHGHCRQ
jgi:hypothetical protein